MDIYVQKDGQQLGPFTETKIRQGIDTGEFDPENLAWTTGKASWQAISALINLDVNQPPPLRNEMGVAPVAMNAVKPKDTLSVQQIREGSQLPTLTHQVAPTGKKPANQIKSRITSVLTAIFVAGLIYYVKFSPIRHSKTWTDFHRISPDGDSIPNISNDSTAIPFGGIGSKASDIYTAYGRAYETPVLKGWLPASHAALFRDGDLSYVIAFWYERAHCIVVFRKDDGELTQHDIEHALGKFTDGSEWIHQVDTHGPGREVWKSETAFAALKPVRSESDAPTDNKVPVNNLIIQTYEFLLAAGKGKETGN